MKISVVIPALNEAPRIAAAVAAVRRQTGPLEVIVVDGGSQDDTFRRAAAADAVLRAPAGRARQMNAGAAHATGDVFFFLHADSELPDGALDAARAALAAPGVAGGTFRLRFDRPTPLLRISAFCTRFPLPRLAFGDRGLFVHRTVFEAVGGYPDIPIFEDLEMVRRVRAAGTFRFLTPAVTTAARRFTRHGPFRQQLRNAYLWLHYQRGTPPERLRDLYPYEPEDG